MYNLELLMCSYIRGYIKENKINIDNNLINKQLNKLTNIEITQLINIGKEYNLKLYYFKDKGILARVKIVLGFLRNIQPSTLLDIGTGRGVFLLPLLCEMPNINVTATDILPHRIEFLTYLKEGGIPTLEVMNQNIVDYNYHENKYEVVTLLEVLEHIDQVDLAVKNAVKLSKKFIVLSVPSKEDDNPEHIHLLTREKLTTLFNNNNVTNLKFEYINGHLIMVARKEE